MGQRSKFKIPLLSPYHYACLNLSKRSSVVGKLPAILRGQTPEQSRSILQDLDWLTRLLRIALPQKSLLAISGTLNDKPFYCQERGNGQYGRVFLFVVKDKRFALKIYKIPGQVGWHGSVGEVYLAAFFSQHHIQDAAKFYLGDPQSGWMLNEWVDSDTLQQERTGESVETIASRHGLSLVDHFERPFPTTQSSEGILERSLLEIDQLSYQDWGHLSKKSGNWSFGRILVDYGGIRLTTPLTPAAFYDRLSSTYYRTFAHQLLFETSHTLQAESNPINTIASRLIPQNERWEYFQQYVRYEDVWGVAEEHFHTPVQLGLVDVEAAFYQACQITDTQVSAVWLLRHLSEAKRFNALNYILKSPSFQPQAKRLACGQLEFLTSPQGDSQQWKLFQWILNELSTPCQAMAVMMLPRLPVKYISQAFWLAFHKNNQSLLDTLAWHTPLLPAEEQYQAWASILSMPNPKLKSWMPQLSKLHLNVISQLLTPILQTPAACKALAPFWGDLPLEPAWLLAEFNKIIDKDKMARRVFSCHIKNLPEPLRWEAFQHALQYPTCTHSTAFWYQLSSLEHPELASLLLEWKQRLPQYKHAMAAYFQNASRHCHDLVRLATDPDWQEQVITAMPFSRGKTLEKFKAYQSLSQRYPSYKRQCISGIIQLWAEPLSLPQFFPRGMVYCYTVLRLPHWLNTARDETGFSTLQVRPFSILTLVIGFLAACFNPQIQNE